MKMVWFGLSLLVMAVLWWFSCGFFIAAFIQNDVRLMVVFTACISVFGRSIWRALMELNKAFDEIINLKNKQIDALKNEGVK